MKIIVGMPNQSIEDPFFTGKILSHLEAMCGSQGAESCHPVVRATARGLLLTTSRATGARLGMVDRYCIRKRRLKKWLRGGDWSGARCVMEQAEGS
jgi:hypothetical protein